MSYYDGSTFTWSDGRKLTGITKGTDTINYAYNADELRVSKTVNGVKTDYYWLDGRLYQETNPSYTLIYKYDESGNVIGFTYKTATTSADYYYVHNIQGEIICIIDSAGTIVVNYNYDPWGYVEAISGTLASTIGVYNPIRYKDYYYDTETGFYYCQSRYYDPNICRWINADDQMSDVGGEILGYNQFAYCFNNPVNYYDNSGTWPSWNKFAKGVLLGTIGVLAVASVAVAAATCSPIVLAGYVALTVGGIGNITIGASEIYESFTEENPLRDAIGEDIYTGVEVSSLALTTAGVSLVEVGSSIPSVCFVEGTKVLTANGLVNIEEIKAGDYVWACNPYTNEVALKKVVQTFVNESDELVRITIKNEEIICTKEHPFYSPIKGWTAACELRAGDILVTINGDYLILEKVQHELLESPITVYNFEVEDYHTYCVSKSNLLVHNMCKPATTKEALSIARNLGYEPTGYFSKGKRVFYNAKTKTYICLDIESHIGGVWKMAKSLKALARKETRMGTYDISLNRIGD